MSTTFCDIKFFNINSFHVRVKIIKIIIISAREENIRIFASKTDVDSILAYMCAKVQTEFDLLNISLRCWQLSIWDTTAEITYATCQERANNRLLNLFLYFQSLCLILSLFNCTQCKNWLTHVSAKARTEVLIALGDCNSHYSYRTASVVEKKPWTLELNTNKVYPCEN